MTGLNVKFLHPKDDGTRTHDCAHCGACSSVTMACQGAKPDLCTERLCWECAEDAARCDMCKLPACDAHISKIGDESVCQMCLASEIGSEN